MWKSAEPIVLTPSRRRPREQIAPIRAPRSKSLSGWPSCWVPPRDSPTGNRPAAWAPHGPPCRCGENASSRPGWRACCGTRPPTGPPQADPPSHPGQDPAHELGGAPPGGHPRGHAHAGRALRGQPQDRALRREGLRLAAPPGGPLPAPHRPQVRGPGARHRGVGR